MRVDDRVRCFHTSYLHSGCIECEADQASKLRGSSHKWFLRSQCLMPQSAGYSKGEPVCYVVECQARAFLFSGLSRPRLTRRCVSALLGGGPVLCIPLSSVHGESI